MEGRDNGKRKDTDAGETEGDATTPNIREGEVRTKGAREGQRVQAAREGGGG